MLASAARSSAVIIGGFGCGIPASSSRSNCQFACVIQVPRSPDGVDSKVPLI
jgi:hypothetical protein